ncbi:MAG: hypothetical protein CR988_06850 [Treponema sp.]|nr:MAG: hypothetical protein CR988_06850 [Treponema sp.]
MKDNIHKNIYKYGISFGIILSLLLLLWGVFVLSSFIRTSSLKDGLDTVFKNSPYAQKYRNIRINKMKLTVIHSDAGMESMLLQGANKSKVEVFIVPMTGMYGVFDGIFVLNKYNEAEFCGLFVNDFSKTVHYYGVSNASIEITKQNINLFKNKE